MLARALRKWTSRHSRLRLVALLVEFLNLEWNDDLKPRLLAPVDDFPFAVSRVLPSCSGKPADDFPFAASRVLPSGSCACPHKNSEIALILDSTRACFEASFAVSELTCDARLGTRAVDQGLTLSIPSVAQSSSLLASASALAAA